MIDYIRAVIYLQSNHGEVVLFKNFNTENGINGIIKKMLEEKKNIIRIQVQYVK